MADQKLVQDIYGTKTKIQQSRLYKLTQQAEMMWHIRLDGRT